MSTSHDSVNPTQTRPQGTAEPTGVATRVQASTTRAQRTPPSTSTEASFPEQLTRAYTPLALVGTGAEGAVWRVRDVRTHAELAVKVHWDNQPMDPDLLAHLDNSAFHRHVPAITDTGRLTTSAGTRDWVAMEYLPTSLADALAELPPCAGTTDPATDDRATAIVAELCALIAFWQDHIDRNPLDFKPANILVRHTGTGVGQFVIADFGGIHRFTASQVHGGASRFNLAYAPPEHTWSEHATPWPWWGLGEIVYELACGQPRFRHRDGGVKADTEIVRGQILGDRGGAIPDERWRCLVRGLLTVDPDDRWTGPQVQAWLDGDAPPVAEEPPAGTSTRTPTELTFGRLHLTDPAEVAAHLLDHGHDAARWLLTEGGATQLATFVDRQGEHSYDTAQLHRLAANPSAEEDQAHLAITALGAAFAPELTPRYAGHAVDVAGLTELATTQPAWLRQLLDQPEVLRTVAVYACGHAACRRLPRCDRIQRLAAEAPALAQQAANDVTQLGQSRCDADATTDPTTDGGWAPLSDAERDHAHTLATLAVLDPAALRTQVEGSRATALLGPHWWRRQVLACDTSDTPAGRRSMVTALLLAERAAIERARTADRPAGGDYARSLGHRVLTGVLAGLAMINAVWAGVGSFNDVGIVLANVFPVIVAAASVLALWPWRSAESAPRALTAITWTVAVGCALAYRGWDGAPPATARAWWPAPDWLVGFLGLLPAPFQVTAWWFHILVATTVVVLAIKFVRLRMRLAYRDRYVHYWHAPRVGPSPEDRLGLAPLSATTWLGLVIVGTVTAGVAHSSGTTITLALLAPPLAYLLVFLAAGAGLLFVSATRALAGWTAMALLALATSGWFAPLRVVDVLEVGPLQAMWLVLLGLAMLGGGAWYLRTRLTPMPTPTT